MKSVQYSIHYTLYNLVYNTVYITSINTGWIIGVHLFSDVGAVGSTFSILQKFQSYQDVQWILRSRQLSVYFKPESNETKLGEKVAALPVVGSMVED